MFTETEKITLQTKENYNIHVMLKQISILTLKIKNRIKINKMT